MLRNSILFVILAGLTWILFQEYSEFESRKELNPVASYYADNGPTETGAANLVTSVVVTYRGLDTLGEVTILFLASAIIGLMLKADKSVRREKAHKSSEFLTTAAHILLPVISLVGVYIFINGHLTPGGGFQGGAILASALILMVISFPDKKFSHKILDITESISGIAFIILGVLGIFLAGGFLDNKIFGLGNLGELFSAGAIPIIYSFIGLKVGAELSGVILEFNKIQGEQDESI